MQGGGRLRVTLLGDLRVSRGDAALTVAGSRLRGLLVRLALAGGRAVEPGTLVDAIWPETPPDDAAHALQALASRLRRTLGPAGSVASVAGGYRLDVDPADVDALRFEELATAGRDRLRAGDPAAAAAALGSALALWGDRPGAGPAVVAAVAPGIAVRLRLASVEAVADLAAAELALGRAAAAADRLTTLLAGHPGDERAAGLLMDALAAEGREAEALGVYERVRAALADELGADPGAALRERHLRLLHAGGPAPAVMGNLPAPVTSFIGRDDDLARLDALLAAGRLVTVVGPGGAGKTRLAVEAARRRRYRDGAWMVDLAGVTEPGKVDAAVLGALGPRGAAGSDVFTERLAGREILLLVDNCEHLVEAVAGLLAVLLPRFAGLRVLATSREPLAVDGEALVPLGPLAVPGPGDGLEPARRAASVRLFAERAAAVRPGFDVDETTLADVRRVVRGLDGLPLAMELAAARLRTLSLPELADGLSDRFRLLGTGRRAAPRHRTLRAVIAWSWELLTEAERTVAERVAVLPGGVTSASAAAVCAGTAVPPGELPELLAALVDRSLLQLAPEPGRYRMLETLREYGIERLVEAGALDAVRDLAAGYFAALLARVDPQLRGPGQPGAIRTIRAEYDNALAALRHRRALRLALDLSWYWHMFGRDAEAVAWLGEALAEPGGTAAERDCAAAILALHGAGPAPDGLAGRLLAYPARPGPFAVLAALLQEPPAVLATLDRLAAGDDVWLSGLAHLFRAQTAENAGELGTARADVEAALDRFQQAGDRWGRATALPLRSLLRQYDDDLDGALADLREARSLAAEFGSLSLGDEVFRALRWIDLYLRRDDTDRAVELIEATRAQVLRAASEPMLVLVDVREAGFRVQLGDPDRARELLEDAERRRPGDTPFSGDHVRTLIGSVRAALLLELGDRAGAARTLAEAYAAGLASGDRPILAVVAVGAAALAGPRESAYLLGAASRLRGAHDRTDPAVRALTRRGREAPGFAAAYDAGWGLTADAAVAEVGRAIRELEAG
ncbi:BTAD domain-containing putative transcriptional regulator [Dactylosporangium sp. NPDC049140]|uniref:BTAD domain-containing putative transcriptional regulator n=1 Tax=Dactylosporangium sp. NPDC049140 TaxID=3155647 RepID=UPI0033C01F0C